MAETEQKNQTNYDSMFAMHERSRDKRRANAAAIAQELVRLHKPSTVIDVGCGKGHFLAEIQAYDAEIAGVDGPWVTEMDPDVDIAILQVQDLEARYTADTRYDLAVSIEVAEHLSPERSETFVEDLIALSDHILFSAAVPGQKGRGHINCQWQGHWADLFAAQGYDCYDPFRRRLAAYPDMAPWFRQNLLYYVKSGAPISQALSEHRIPPVAASYLLPANHQRPIRTLQRTCKELLNEVADLRAALPPRTLGADHPHRPAVLENPRAGEGDVLRSLKGMGKQHEYALNYEGIFHYDQVAALSPENITWLRAYCLGFTDATPIERWVEDARAKASI